MYIHGLDINIETPKGRSRTGVGADGKRWVGPALSCSYGEIKGTRAKDGDRVDAYIGPDRDSPKVWVIDQVKAETGKYDEAKTLIGFRNKDAALSAYRAAFSDGKANDRIGAITEMSVGQFQDWLAKPGATKKPAGSLKGYAEGGAVRPDVAHLYQHHQKELGAGGVRNPDGSISTVFGMTAPDESGRHRMLPRVWDGQVLPPDAAYARSRSEGLWNYPGSFSPTRTLYNYMRDPEQHPRMEQDVADYLNRATGGKVDMPLKTGANNIGSNISTLEGEGKKRAQAIAIALSVAGKSRQKKADGGGAFSEKALPQLTSEPPRSSLQGVDPLRGVPYVDGLIPAAQDAAGRVLSTLPTEVQLMLQFLSRSPAGSALGRDASLAHHYGNRALAERPYFGTGDITGGVPSPSGGVTNNNRNWAPYAESSKGLTRDPRFNDPVPRQGMRPAALPDELMIFPETIGIPRIYPDAAYNTPGAAKWPSKVSAPANDKKDGGRTSYADGGETVDMITPAEVAPRPRSPMPEYLLQQLAQARNTDRPLHGQTFPSGLFEPLSLPAEMTGIPSIARGVDAYREGRSGDAAGEIAPLMIPFAAPMARGAKAALGALPKGMAAPTMFGLGASALPTAAGEPSPLDRLLAQQAELSKQRAAAQAERDLQVKGAPNVKGGRGKNYDAAVEELARIDKQAERVGELIANERKRTDPDAMLKAEKERKAFEEAEKAKEYGRPIREYLPPWAANSVLPAATLAAILASRKIGGKFNTEYQGALEGYRVAEKEKNLSEMALRQRQIRDLENPSVGQRLTSAAAAGIPLEVRGMETLIDANRDPTSRASQEAWERLKDPTKLAIDVGSAAGSSAFAHGIGRKFAPNAPDRSLGRSIAADKPYAAAPALADDYGTALKLSEDLGRLGQTAPGVSALGATPLASGTAPAVQRALDVTSRQRQLPAPAASPNQSTLGTPFNDNAQSAYRIDKFSHPTHGKVTQERHNENGQFGKRVKPEDKADTKSSKGNKTRTTGDEGEFNRGGSVNNRDALDLARKYAQGGHVGREPVHVGPVEGRTGGRDDKLPISVPSGSYVLPADFVSGLPQAQGNTAAGMAALVKMFGKPSPHMAAGGAATPISISDGEFVVSPDQVAKIGGGSMEQGHRILDALVTKVRAQHVKTLKSLPGPSR